MIKKVAGLAAFLLVAYGLTVIIGAKILGFSFQGGYQLSATFDDVTQLFHGDPVYLAGVKVGQVKSIHLDRKLQNATANKRRYIIRYSQTIITSINKELA